MDIVVYDKQFRITKYIDSYDSLIWNVKYIGHGEFELVVAHSQEFMSVLSHGNYLSIDDSDRWMIVEKTEPIFDDEKGALDKFSGRSLESILLRRIVWAQTTISGNLQNGIKKLITDAIISPAIPARRISNFVFRDSTDPRITSLVIDEHQYTGTPLYDVIVDLCTAYKIGFKITVENGVFVFELFSGTDRSSNQVLTPIIEFSIDNDNLLGSNYSKDETKYYNVTLVAGEGEGPSRKTAVCGDYSGLDRREIFTDARDLQESDGETTLSSQEYTNLLIARGNSKLLEHAVVTELDTEVDSAIGAMYVFGRDYFLGDVVDVIDFINQKSTSRITQMTISVNDDGYSVHPIFENEEAA